MAKNAVCSEVVANNLCIGCDVCSSLARRKAVAIKGIDRSRGSSVGCAVG